MKPYLQDPDLTLYNGDSFEVLRGLPEESVHMCVTSPPFFGLRDYGVDGQIGLEDTPEGWVSSLVAVFEEVRRVLRSDGTLWVECGDSYAGGGGGNYGSGLSTSSDHGQHITNVRNRSEWLASAGVKQKDLLGSPFLLAFALREAGWYWRNVCIWHKPNPMPESVRDRFTVSHSYVLLFSKSPRYFFDAEAVREAWSEGTAERYAYGYNASWKRAQEASVTDERTSGFRGSAEQLLGAPTLDGSEGETPRGPDGRRQTGVKAGDNSIQHRDGERWPNSGRNARSVWTIPTQPLPFEHYAAFPEALAERCIKAGTSEKGCCPECGAPWAREIESETIPARENWAADESVLRNDKDRAGGFYPTVTESGWRPSCEHGQAPTPAVVLDPFGGSGTTALVARRLGRRAILTELNESYCDLTARRTQQLSLMAE